MRTATLAEAIHQKKVVEFRYEGRTRVVEPHTVGMMTSGAPGLRAYQVDGYSESRTQPSWRLYRVDKMSGLVVTNQTFAGPRPGYRQGDSDFARIEAEL